MLGAAALVVAACGATKDLPSAASRPAETDETTETTASSAGSGDGAVDADADVDAVTSTSPATANGGAVTIRIDPSASLGTFDRRLLGTNVPAWLGADRFEQPEFQDALRLSGATVIRMPGGSWSNAYDWLACESADESGCFWTWASRPSDFAELLEVTGLSGMWTVSINETAQQAAALVAFFNGDVGDPTVIGVDREGVDWGTVGEWASLRAEGGHPDPVGIELWEVGNEVYAGKPETAGAGCAGFGWEDVWTCDGADYVTGVDGHDGYLAIRDAMRGVDPDILVGAVGVVETSGWGGWGDEVIETAGDDLDFYVIHQYGFDRSASVSDIVDWPHRFWPSALDDLAARLGTEVPVALTEHNLVAVADGDTDATMTHASNAIFLADTLGQMALGSVSMANQWDFASGTADSGTNYGLLDADTLAPFPAFFSLALWSRFGEEVVDVQIDGTDGLGAYAGREADGTITLIVVNRTGSPVPATLSSVGGAWDSASVDTVAADDPASSAVRFNGVDATDLGVVSSPAQELDVTGSTVDWTAPAWSVSLVRLAPAG